ncbi:MAG: hypothetical protein QXP04_03905 [Candidatus Nanoarchaeia archaeon]|nr:hypothetical protein [Candidatus Jingweiarchaeum tengchongense]
MECRYCSEKAVANVVLSNGAKINVCEKDRKFIQNLGITRFEAIDG